MKNATSVNSAQQIINFVPIPNQMVREWKKPTILEAKFGSVSTFCSCFALPTATVCNSRNKDQNCNKLNRQVVFSGITDVVFKLTVVNASPVAKFCNSLKDKNLEKIKKMSLFKADWNGNDSLPFTIDAISIFERVIRHLPVQPEIAPTGRNSLLLQYERKDGDMLLFELKENNAEMAFISKGDFTKAQCENIDNDVVNTIVKRVEELWCGFKPY